MRSFKIYILSLYFFISCDVKSKETTKNSLVDEIIIPAIEKNLDDENLNLKNGVLFFLNKPYSGIINAFYKDGSLKSISTYYQGKKEGKFFGFYPSQDKWFERYYSKGIKVNTHKGWFQNGQQMFEYQFNKKGVYNGFTKDWFEDGKLAKHFNFENGKEVGSQKMWKPTGKIKANFFTVNGERHGLIGLKNCVSVLTIKDE